MAKDYDWGSMLTTREWAEALKDILADADGAVKREDVNAISSSMNMLRTFIKKSPPKCQSLDNIAHALLSDLLVADMSAATKAIASHSSALNQHVDVINGVANDAKKSAEQLRLEPVISQMEKAKEALVSLKKEIEEKKEQGTALYGKVTDVLAGVQRFLG